MTLPPDERPSEPARLRRKRPDDSDARAHQEIARRKELKDSIGDDRLRHMSKLLRQPECLWIAGAAISAFYFLAYFCYPR